MTTEKKRKTKTSSQVTQRYKDKVYTVYSTRLKNDEYAQLNAKLKEADMNKAQFIRKAANVIFNLDFDESPSEK